MLPFLPTIWDENQPVTLSSSHIVNMVIFVYYFHILN